MGDHSKKINKQYIRIHVGQERNRNEKVLTHQTKKKYIQEEDLKKIIFKVDDNSRVRRSESNIVLKKL